MKDYADLHTHTIASGHAYGTITEMVHAEMCIRDSTKSVPSMSKNNAFLFILFYYRISAVSISAQHFAE